MVETKAKSIKVLLTGGGTGGHLFPAIATAQKILEYNESSEVLFVGTKRKMDKSSLEMYGFVTSAIHSYGLKGKSASELVKALLILPVSFVEATIILLRFRPDIVLGVGGYVTGPVVFMANLLGFPTIIHEQNTVPGLANRKLGRFVKKICASLPVKKGCFPENKLVMTGNPVRQELVTLAHSSVDSERESLVFGVLGGSQGAHSVNMFASKAFCICKDQGLDFSVFHQTGENDVEQVKASYENAGIKSEVAPFFSDMVGIYSKCDFFISRAGATTLSELAVLGLPAVLIPYPHAADNHQQTNAEYFVNGGGAIMFGEKELSPENLAASLLELVSEREHLKVMGRRMKELGKSDAAERIVEQCYQLLRD